MESKTPTDLLQTVSRSFALCIPLLEKNKSGDVENMYLLSRVVDTIEDSSLGIEEKKCLMREFFLTLKDESHIEGFVDLLRQGTIDAHDKVLSSRENYRTILEGFNCLDEGVKRISISLLAEMSSGMIEFLGRGIETFDDLDEYCYYVAGTVGLYMNRIVAIKDGVMLDEQKAISLGRYLQKVNIIKNFAKDCTEGRHFWPTSLLRGKGDNMAALESMLRSAKSEAQNSFEYISSVPYRLAGYRKFLLLAGLMATENLRLMHENQEVFTNQNGVKIPRNRMPEIFSMVEEAACSNDALWKIKRELEGFVITVN